MKVLVHGSYFSPNFGDVLLWRHCVNLVRQALPNAEIFTLNRPDALSDYYPALRASRTEGFDLVVFTGGGYFCSPGESHFWELRNWQRHRVALKFGSSAKCALFLGVGFGHFMHPWFRNRLRHALGNAAILAVRDDESLSAVVELTSSPVQVVPDLALTASATLVDGGLDSTDGSRSVAIHADFSGMAPDRQELFTESCRRLIRTGDHEVKFLVDCPSKSARKSADAVASALGVSNPQLVVFNGDLSNFLGEIQSSEVVATTKLHVGICATALGRPVLSVPKHHKTLRFYKQVGLDYSVVTTNLGIDEYINERCFARDPNSSVRLQELRKAGDNFENEIRNTMSLLV